MLAWAVILFDCAVITGILAFSGIPIAPTEIAKVLFWVLLVSFLVTLTLGLARRRRGRVKPGANRRYPGIGMNRRLEDWLLSRLAPLAKWPFGRISY